MNLEGDEDYKPHHVYKNGQSFLELEKDLKESTVGAVTYYFFNQEKDQLKGGVTLQEMNGLTYQFVVESFEVFKSEAIKVSKTWDLQFVTAECIRYFANEYYLKDGHHIFKRTI